MAGIHGAVFVVLGLAVAGFSYYITYMREVGNFIIFIIAGIAMAAYGAAKLFFRTGLRGGKAAKPKVSRSVKYCRRCGAAAYSHARFCWKCGAKF